MRSSSSGDRPVSGPLSVEERRRAHPSRAVRTALSLAVAPLPAAHRDRYTLEFLAELHDVGRSAQLRHTLGLVAHAWELRLALHDTSTLVEKGPVMRKSIRCTLRVHHDVLRHNGEAQPPSMYYQCTRCGRIVDPPSMADTGLLGFGG